MDHRVFLRDIDDWELYAKGLEAHIGAWHEALTEVEQQFLDSGDSGWWYCDKLQAVSEDLTRVLKESADRYQRFHGDREARLTEADALTQDELHPDEAEG